MLETISDTMRRAYNLNWITARDGNVSVRYPNDNHFWVTPSGIRKTEMAPSLFKKVSVTGTVLPYTDVSSGLKPSGELPMHLRLQAKVPHSQIRVVMHFHPTYIVAAMHAGIRLDTLVASFPELGRYTSVGPNVDAHLPLTEALARESCENLGLSEKDGSLKHDIVGMKGHGVVAVDSTPWRAFEHIERLEHICKIVLASKI